MGVGLFCRKMGGSGLFFFKKWVGVGESGWEWLGMGECGWEKLGAQFGKAQTRMTAWLLLTFFICLHNQLTSIHSIITYKASRRD